MENKELKKAVLAKCGELARMIGVCRKRKLECKAVQKWENEAYQAIARLSGLEVGND